MDQLALFDPRLAPPSPWPAGLAIERDWLVPRLVVAPRSIYRMQGPSRWQWQHSVAPVDAMRWSITFRTRATRSTSRRR